MTARTDDPAKTAPQADAADKKALETRLDRLNEGIRKAEQRLEHDRLHGETDLGMVEQSVKTETLDKKAGAV